MLIGGVRLAQLALTAARLVGESVRHERLPVDRTGWLANAGTTADPSGRLEMSIGNLVGGAIQAMGMVGTAQWWGFWLANLGIAVPLLAFVALATARAMGRRRSGRASDAP